MGLLQPAPLGRMGPGEGTLFVSKQLRLNQPLRDGRAAHLHQFPRNSLRGSMDQARDQFLAGPALTLDQNRNVCFRNHFQLAPDHLHLGCAAKNDFHRGEIELCFVL